MRIIIELLPDELKKECEIWCSSQSEQQAGEYYPQENIGTHLTKQILYLLYGYRHRGQISSYIRVRSKISLYIVVP